jgi:ArsR family transcriptional regulator, arsenate/arsenite/antimonite-responsive transcriptional repressor
MKTVHAPLDTETLARVSKALGHPARIKIIQHLLEMDSCICGRIVEILPLAQSTVSQHLKILRESGLIKGVVDGPRLCYCIDRNVFEAFKKTIERLG